MAIGSSILHPLYVAIPQTYLAGPLDMKEKAIHGVAEPQELQPSSSQPPFAVDFTPGIIRSTASLLRPHAAGRATSVPRWRGAGYVDEVRGPLIQWVRKGGARDET